MMKGKKLSKVFKEHQSNNYMPHEDLKDINLNDIWKMQFKDTKTNDDLKILKVQYTNLNKDIKNRFED